MYCRVLFPPLYSCCNNNTAAAATLLENLLTTILLSPMWWNCRPFPFIWLYFTSDRALQSVTFSKIRRARNSLIGFLSESLVFCDKMSEWAIQLKKTRDSLIHSFLVSDLSDLLMVAHFWWATWAICSHCSILVSDLSDLLTSFIKKEGMSESLIY